MTEVQYVLWFIGTTLGVLLILGLGTMKMAGLLGRHERAESGVTHGHRADHHHWYDRFHLHHHAA